MSVFERVRLLGFGLLAVTFMVGALAGAAVDRIITGNVPEAEARETRRDRNEDRRYIIDRVEMSDSQRATIDSILKLRVDRMRAVWREVEPRMDAITDSARSEIMEILTPEQQAEYETLLDRRRRERDDEDGRRGEETQGYSPAPFPLRRG